MLCQSSGELEKRVFLIGETRREGRSGAGKIRAYLPTEPPSVAQVERGLEGIGVKAAMLSNSCGLLRREVSGCARDGRECDEKDGSK
jgi:hypothetical protein